MGDAMFDYDVKIEKNRKRNEKYIKGFEKWLSQKGLAKKTIRKHSNNAELYIDNYLTYYDITVAEDGTNFVYSFLDDWFIRKCLWSSRNSLKETAASIKKFYQYMSENNYVSKNNYKDMCNLIKENMPEFLKQMDAYDNEIYNDIF